MYRLGSEMRWETRLRFSRNCLSLSLNIINNSELRQFFCRIWTSLMYRSALRDNPDCGRTQHCRHRASGTQDEREIQLRVQLTHVGDNNAAKKYRRPLQVPFAIISLRVQRAVPIRPPLRRSLTSHEGQHSFPHDLLSRRKMVA